MAEVVKPPLATGMDVAGKDGAAAKAVSAAAARLPNSPVT